MIGYKNIWKKEQKGESTISKEEFMMGASGIWKLKTQTKEITKANFSTDLPEMCIKLLSFSEDLIYDPFIGGGTTAVAAKMNNRNFIGSEISQEYCNVANERLKTA